MGSLSSSKILSAISRQLRVATSGAFRCRHISCWFVIIAFLIQSVGRQWWMKILALYKSDLVPSFKKKRYFHIGLTCQNQQTMKYLPWQALGWLIHSTVSLYSVPVPRFLLFTESFYLPMQITGQTLSQFLLDYLACFLCTYVLFLEDSNSPDITSSSKYD